MYFFLRVLSVYGRSEGVTIMKPSGGAFKIVVLVMVMAGLFLSSCGKSKDQEKKDQEQQEQEKAIKMLEEIESVNESIILILNGPASPRKGEGQEQQQGNGEQQNQQQDQQGQQDQQQGSDEQQDQQQGKDQQQQGNGEQQDQQGQQDQQQGKDQQQKGSEEQQNQQQQQGKESQEQKPQDKIWKDVNENIIELHSLLNEYIPAAAKLGASTELSSNANDALNQLTKRAEAKDHNEVLTEANNLYKAICDYFTLHRDKRAPAKLLLYHARRVMLAAKVGDWQTAGEAMDELKEMWNTQKTSYGEDQKDDVAMLDLSVSNLSGVVDEKNQNLVAIKGLLVLQSISELEKGLEEK
jgi:hypothetical protein